MKEEEQKKDLYESAIQERILNKKFIYYMFNEYMTKHNAKTEVSEINGDISKDKLLSLYCNVPVKEEAIPISDGISLEKKIANHIDINTENFINFSNKRISGFISSIDKICKYYQRKLFYENYCIGMKENKDNLVYEIINKFNEILYKNEQGDIENNTKKILIITFILKRIALYHPFILYENEDIFIKNYNIMKKFKSYPNPIGHIGSQISSILYNETYLPGVSLLNRLTDKFDVLLSEVTSNVIYIDEYNSYYFLYSDKNLFDISEINSITNKRDTIKISNLITYILILFNAIDPSITSKPERFDYIYNLYSTISEKSDMIQKLKSMLNLIKDSYKYDRSILLKHISEFNRELIEKEARIIHTQSQNRYSYIELIELFKYLKPIIIKKTITKDYPIDNFLNEIKDTTKTIKVIIYEENFEHFLFAIKSYEELISKIEIYLLPNPNETDNKFSSIIAMKDILYNNLIYQPFTSLDKDKENSIPHLKSIKSFLNLYLTDTEHTFPLFYYKESTSLTNHIVFDSSIIITNISRNEKISLQNEFIFEIYIKDKLTSTFYSSFDSLEIITKNILYANDCVYAKTQIELNKTALLLIIQSQYIPCDKIVIKHSNNEEKISYNNIIGQTETVSRFCIEGLHSNSFQMHLSVKTFC